MPFLEVIRSFDRNPAYVSINYNGRKVHKSRTGGCISVIFLISVVFIFFFKINSMRKQQNMSFQILIGKDNFGTVNLQDANIRMTIKNSNDVQIPCLHLKNYNLKIFFESKQIYEHSKEKYQSQQMQPCSNSTDQTQFCIKSQSKGLNLSGRLDVPMMETQQQKLDHIRKINNNQSQDKLIYRQFRIKLSESQNPINISNNQTKITPFITFTNHVINQQKKDLREAIQTQKRVFKTDSPLNIHVNQTQKRSLIYYTFEIKKVIMITDFSILPSTIKNSLPFFYKNQQSNSSWFYGEEFIAETYTQQDKRDLFVAIFMRSIYTNTYIRHFDKLDTVLAEGFGLTGLLSMVLFCLYQGYNGWVLQKQNIGEQKSVNIFDFYKHQLKNFCIFVTKIIGKLLRFFKLYNCLRWIQKKLCYCLFEEKQIEQRTQSFLNQRRLEQELDIYRSRRQINFLKKRIQIMYSAMQIIGKRLPQVQVLLDQQVRLSKGYEMSQSLITSFRSHGQKDNSENLSQQQIRQKYKEDLLLQ